MPERKRTIATPKPRPTKTRWGDAEARRADILAAATRLLERHGYGGLTMRDVAQGAGVNVATVYTYFDGKEALFAALYTARLERFHGEITPLCAAAGSAEDLFVDVAGRYLEVYEVFGRELDVWALMRGSKAQPRHARPLVQAALAIVTTVQAAVDRLAAPVRPRDRGLAVNLLWVTLQGLCAHFTGARHLVHPYSWDELTRYAARTLTRGLAREGEED